jgi:DNA replication and repair protein RecF
LRVRALRAWGWRNLQATTWSPGARLSVLFGDNGQGKTNLIEAIYYMATLRSFRTTHALDLVQAGAEVAKLAADVELGGLERTIELSVAPGARVVKVDGKAVRGAGAIFGALSVVLFVPEDLLLPRAPPVLRRKFLDLAVFNVERSYYREASAFQKVLKNRNALLRKGMANPNPTLFDTYDEELARTGARVVLRRRSLVQALSPLAQGFFERLHPRLSITLRYRGDPTVDQAETEEEVASALLVGLRRRRDLDERRRFTGFGPHTDDLELGLGDRLAREHASQGQLRSLVLALKLAELSFVDERRGDSPVLLLDDVPSELDATRRRYLFEMLGSLSCQTVITTTDRGVIPSLAERHDFAVTAGVIENA